MVYSGYSGIIWSTVYRTLAYYTAQLTLFSTGQISAATMLLLSETMLQTLNNAVAAIDAYAIYTAWRAEVSALQGIAALALILDTPTQTVFNARLAAYENAVTGIGPIIIEPPYGQPADIARGVPSIASVDLLEFFEAFSYETPPVGTNASNLLTNAASIATAFLNVANAIITLQDQSVLTQSYDIAYREYQAALSVWQLLDSLTSGGFSDLAPQPLTWNQIVTLPAMTLISDNNSSAPFSLQNQQQAVLRNVMLQAAIQISALVISLDQPLTAQISMTVLRNKESLMDVAARATGNYENWTQIATLNGLAPPYVGAQSSPGIAGWGSKLILPTPGTTLSAVGTLPNYLNNFLGVDVFIGPLNGSMPTWAGDFQTISGYGNLSISLGRRLQTTQGTLIYHPTFGSRIPPQVGQVMSARTAGHITAFGKSAILSDPRVASVSNAQTLVPQANVLQFSADVQPSGFRGTRISLNEVLTPL